MARPFGTAALPEAERPIQLLRMTLPLLRACPVEESSIPAVVLPLMILRPFGPPTTLPDALSWIQTPYLLPAAPLPEMSVPM